MAYRKNTNYRRRGSRPPRYHGFRGRRPRRRFPIQLVSSAVIVAGLAVITTVNWLSGKTSNGEPQSFVSTSTYVYYRYCSEARAAGVAPLYRGEPGYRVGLDADEDGIACEPYP